MMDRSHEPAVQVQQLQKRFGQTLALDGVSFTVRSGTVLGLLGPNGAGKTTVVRILATLLGPDGGHAWVDGHEVVEDAQAGVQAGKRGGFGLVIGIDREGMAEELRAHGADVVVDDLEEVTMPVEDEAALAARVASYLS